jgi:spermidine synthase
MLPWSLLGSAHVPGGGEIRLHRRGDEFSIRVGGYELMNSRVHGSEDALASLACARLRQGPAPRVLIGGLGMGFTLAGVLRALGREARVVVAELVPEVVEWNRGPLAHLAGQPLADARVSVRVGDVGMVIAESRGAFDAILLDVDNGPAGLTSESNNRLYTPGGLRAAHNALRPEGLLAVWSAGADPAFTRRLQQAGFRVEEVPVRGRDARRGPRFLIWIASR